MLWYSLICYLYVEWCSLLFSANVCAESPLPRSLDVRFSIVTLCVYVRACLCACHREYSRMIKVCYGRYSCLSLLLLPPTLPPPNHPHDDPFFTAYSCLTQTAAFSRLSCYAKIEGGEAGRKCKVQRLPYSSEASAVQWPASYVPRLMLETRLRGLSSSWPPATTLRRALRAT